MIIREIIPALEIIFYKARFYYEMFGGDKIPVKVEVESGIAAQSFSAEYLFEKFDDFNIKINTNPALLFAFTKDPVQRNAGFITLKKN